MGIGIGFGFAAGMGFGGFEDLRICDGGLEWSLIEIFWTY